MKLMRYLILLLIIFNFSDIEADERNNQLDTLFNKLKLNNNNSTYETEQKIWEIWITHPSNPKLTQRLADGSRLLENKKFLKAAKIFTEVINEDPKWAEAWNKRATVLYLIGDYKRSQNDIDKVLELEKRHFGALAGQGLVNIKLENYEKAIKSYQRAKEIYPAMQSPDIMIRQIEALIKQQLI